MNEICVLLSKNEAAALVAAAVLIKDQLAPSQAILVTAAERKLRKELADLKKEQDQ